jgi:ribose 5-phosphate isomerase A
MTNDIIATDDRKRAAAWAAVEEVQSGMLIGLGTGSTAVHAVRRLGDMVREGLGIRAVATSVATENLARAMGIPLLDFASIDAIDLAIDGADELDDRLFAIKGAGGAMLREKVVAAAARRMIVIADASKRSAAIGRAPVPVEILPFAQTFVRAQLDRLGAQTALRRRDGEPFRTDQDNLVVDCVFAALPDPAEIAGRIAEIPGVLGHGLFLTEVDSAYIGGQNGVVRLDRPAA